MRIRIKELRARYGLTQDELAEKVGCARQTIIAIESGEGDPKLSTLVRIADVFGCEIGDLFFYDDRLTKIDK